MSDEKANKDNNTLLLQQYLIKNINDLRISRGYSLMKLAELTDISTTFMGEIEKGRKYPSASTLQKLSEALGVRPYQLFLSSEDKKEYNKVKTLIQLEKELQENITEDIRSVIKKYLK